jgi:hypothetical protein
MRDLCPTADPRGLALACLLAVLGACGGDNLPANVPDASGDVAKDVAPDAPAPDLPAPPLDVAPDQPPMDVADDLAPDLPAPDLPAPDAPAPDAPEPDVAPDLAVDVTPECPTGQQRCDGVCRDVLTDPAHCGACGNACGTAANASVTCLAGRCERRCATGFGDCDGDAANGCETSLQDALAHCGACGRACAPPNATAACAAGRCGVAACVAGFGDCDTDPANGCEIPLNANNEHCGMCGRRCAAGEACAMGACAITCVAGTTLCGTTCANLQADVSHCGACGRACVTPSGVPLCRDGACGLAACLTGFGDCDATLANGCEVDLRTSARHCGACGRACLAGHRCEAGACVAPRNTADILLADPRAPSGTYTIDPDGTGPLPPLPLYVDFTTDGGGWVLVWKSNMANNNDRTDAGYNIAALAAAAVDDVAVLPRPYVAALGSTFRVVSGDGSRRFFWRGVPFYTTDNHGRPEGSVAAVETTVDITVPFHAGQATFYGSHALCVFDGLANVTPGHTFAEHFCAGRWCCGPNAGTWWNYGRWSPGSYTSATAWAR